MTNYTVDSKIHEHDCEEKIQYQTNNSNIKMKRVEGYESSGGILKEGVHV